MTYRKSMSDAIREVQEATIKPYVSMSMSGQYNILDKDGKVAYSTRDKTLAYDYFKKNFDKLKEDEDHEVSMAIGQLKTISQYAEKMQTILQSKGNDYDIEAWVQSKITSAEDYMNSVAHYMENDPSVNEEVNEVSDIKKLAVLKRKIKQYKDKVFKKTMSTIKSPLFAGYEEVEEGRMKDIFTADQEGKSAEEIAKIMKLPLKTVKGILGEEVFEEISEFTSDMIKRLQKSYSTMPKTISPEQAKALSKHLDRLDLASLKQLTKANIPFVTTLARNKVYKKTGKFEAVEEPKQDMPDDKEKVAKENSDKEIASLKDQIAMLKTKLENEKNKAVKPEPNPKTGEVPLTVGVAYKHFKDAEEKEKKEEVSEKTMSDRDKRIQRAKDMIKYYDAQKKAALKGKNKDLAKKMLKNDIEETVSIKAYKNAVDPSKKGLMISKSGGMSGTIMIKDKKELKDLETKIAQAKRLYNIKETLKKNDLEEATKNTDFKVKMKTPSGMKTVNVTVPVKNFKVDMAAIEDAARKKVKGDMIDFDFKGDIKEMKKDDAYAIGMAQAKKSMNDEPPLEKKTIKKGHEIAKKILNKENTSAFNPTVHNKTLGVTSKDLDRAFKKLSNQAQSHVNDLLRTGMGTRDAIKKAKEKFKENNINEDRRLYIESITGLKKKAEKSGMPYSILKKVYDRGMAAWKSGHRPGASQQQWAFARVNSFITKSSGTWGGADKDLAKQVKG